MANDTGLTSLKEVARTSKRLDQTVEHEGSDASRCQTDAQIGPKLSNGARPRGFEPLTFGSVAPRGADEYVWKALEPYRFVWLEQVGLAECGTSFGTKLTSPERREAPTMCPDRRADSAQLSGLGLRVDLGFRYGM
jgi:hypothetical protein